MKTNELFKIIDACNPSISQIKAYLERISGQTPEAFELVFKKDGKLFNTSQIAANQGELIGFVFGKTLFYFKALTKEALENKKDFSLQDVLDFGKQLHPKASPLTKEQILMVAKKAKSYANLCDRLSVFGYSIPALPNSYLLFKDGNVVLFDLEFEDTNYSNFSISNFLQDYGNIYFCVSL